jgi:hypothetical protein
LLKVYTVGVHDATGEQKTAENLLAKIERILDLVTGEWGTIVIALVTDASSEARKARRLFAAKYPHIIVLDCYSHQVSLIPGPLFMFRLVKFVHRSTWSLGMYLTRIQTFWNIWI